MGTIKLRAKIASRILGALLGVMVFFSIPLGVTPAGEAHFPVINNYVTDEAQMLSAGERNELEALLRDFASKTGNQLVVVTIPQLPEGEDLERYAHKLAESSGAGTAQADNGLLLLVVRDERSVRIEVGYGLEDEITDGRAGRIIRQIIIPSFQAGLYSQGISQALLTLIKWIDPSFLPVQISSGLPEPGSASQGGLGFFSMFLIFLVLIVLSSLYSRADRRRWAGRGYSQSSFGPPVIILPRGGRRGPGGFGGFGGFSGGGGGFSGGGGGFGGGGASGRW